ncbi:MAG: hypothetical protein M1592_03100 [Candidatus Thermoplasmatota archaeon]|nr:hypothetical protein [Candidatus Thermoplasmatota archaeon]
MIKKIQTLYLCITLFKLISDPSKKADGDTIIPVIVVESMYPIVFRRQIRRSGNSWMITLPPELIENLGLREGVKMQMEAEAKGIFLRVVK